MNPHLRKRLALPLLVVALGLSACSTTDKQQAAANPVDKDGLPILTDEQKDAGIICTSEPVTGSRLSKKKCTTPEQRERDKKMGQEQVQETQRRNTGPTIFQ